MEVLQFDGAGHPPCPVDRLAGLPETGFAWIDFDRGHSASWNQKIEQATGLKIHEAHVNDANNLEHPSFSDQTDAYDMIIFRGLAPLDGDPLASRPTVLFLAEHLLVTIRPSDSRSVVQVRERLLAGKTRVPCRPVGLGHQILSSIVDRYLEVRQRLAENLESWQQDLLDPHHPFEDWVLLLRERGSLRKLEALAEQQEEAIVRWRAESSIEVDESLSVRFNDLLEHIRRVESYSRHLQGEIDTLVQMHFSAVSHRTNEIVRALTVITAIFLPLTLIAGIFGMNFENMPELGWRYAYFVALALMVTIAVGMFVFFRRKRWF